MEDIIDPQLKKAINETSDWIKISCVCKENKPEKRDELYQEILLNICKSDRLFRKKKIESPQAWVKGIARKIIATHIASEMKKRKNKNEFVKVSHTDKKEGHIDERPLELQIVINYVEKEFSWKDRSILQMSLTGESHKDIAKCVGMEVESVANRISILKKRLYVYFRKDGKE